jgi:hypothetical protein
MPNNGFSHEENRKACVVAMVAMVVDRHRQPHTPAVEARRRVLKERAEQRAKQTKKDGEASPSRGLVRLIIGLILYLFKFHSHL